MNEFFYRSYKGIRDFLLKIKKDNYKKFIIVEGINPVIEAVKNNLEPFIFIFDKKYLKRIIVDKDHYFNKNFMFIDKLNFKNIDLIKKALKELKYINNKDSQLILNFEKFIDYAFKNKIPVLVIDEKSFSKLTSSTTGYNILGVFFNRFNLENNAFEKLFCDLTEKEKEFKFIDINNNVNDNIKREDKNIVLLDSIQDPMNLGAIIRNCVAFDIKNIIVYKDSVNPFSPKVIRSSAGNIFYLKTIYRLKDKIILNKLKKYFLFIGFSGRTGNLYSNFKIDKNINYIFVFGNEGRGISSELEKFIDKWYKIEMNKNIDSLNLAVSTGIVLYKIFLQYTNSFSNSF